MNPFRYSEPLPPAELIDREGETATLVETAVSGNSRLLAPRRPQRPVTGVRRR